MATVIVVEIEGDVVRKPVGKAVSGNWAVEQLERRRRNSSHVLHALAPQRGDSIRGSIRTTQFYYPHQGRLRNGRQVHDRRLDDGWHERKEGDVRGTRRWRLAAARVSASSDRYGVRAVSGASRSRREGAMPARVAALPARHAVAYNGLAKTPPMGWNSWNKFAGRVDDAAVRGMADAMASNGMREAGYQYINIDDTWEGNRDAQGNITTNSKFPNMKALADYVHAKGLKLGIYCRRARAEHVRRL